MIDKYITLINKLSNTENEGNERLRLCMNSNLSGINHLMRNKHERLRLEGLRSFP